MVQLNIKTWQRRAIGVALDLSRLEKGDKIAGYRIVRKMGKSLLRETYKAEHPVLDRRVAIKFCTDAKRVDAFLLSAKLMGRLEHPHISVLYDAGEIDGVPFIVTEFVDGIHLGDLFQDHEHFDLTTLLRIMHHVAAALSHAHSRGVLHRNIKPQNIIIDQAGRPKLSDFEIAIPIGIKPEFHSVTPTYMAPEQAAKEQLTEKVDIWGVGATLYWALSGRSVPYAWTEEERDAFGIEALLSACRTFLLDRIPISYECLTDRIPHYVIKILEDCLAYPPDARWRTAAHLSAGLEAAISQIEIDANSPTVQYVLPREGQTIVTYVEAHGDELSGDYRQYELGEFLGHGTFGIVHRARETFSERVVALKFLKPEHLHDREAIERFRRESKLLARISHPNVIRLYSQGRIGPTFFLALQLLDLNDLEAVLKRKGPLSEPEACNYAVQMLAGVARLHESGIVHRDLKPANMGFCGDHLLVGDLGLAQDSDITGITAVGTLMGTVAYMAPEQVKGEPATFASDIFSIGIILYRMLTGRLPHESASLHEMLRRIQFDEVQSINTFRTGIAPELSELVMSMVSKDAGERLTANEALEAVVSIGKQSD